MDVWSRGSACNQNLKKSSKSDGGSEMDGWPKDNIIEYITRWHHIVLICTFSIWISRQERLTVWEWQSKIKCSTVTPLKWPVSANDCRYGLIWCNQGVTVLLINLIKLQRPVMHDFLMTTFNHSGPSPCFFLVCNTVTTLKYSNYDGHNNQFD